MAQVHQIVLIKFVFVKMYKTNFKINFVRIETVSNKFNIINVAENNKMSKY